MPRSCAGMWSASGLVAVVASLLLVLEAPPSLATHQLYGGDERTPDQSSCNVAELMQYLLGDPDSCADWQQLEELCKLQQDYCNGFGPKREDCLLDRSKVQNGEEGAVCSRTILPLEEDARSKLHLVWSDPTKTTSNDLTKENQIANCLAMLSKQLHCTSDVACKRIKELVSSAQRSGTRDGSLLTLTQEYSFFNESACESGYLKGFYFDVSNKMWLDRDECSENTSVCAHECENTFGSFRCKCRAGYDLQADQRSCKDINECRLNVTECDQECVNTAGSFKCKCRKGFSLMSDGTTCIDIDECQQNKTICSQICVNTIGSYKCKCHKGLFLLNDNWSCDDEDECAFNSRGRRVAHCSHICTNKAFGFACSCPEGFVMNMKSPSQCLKAENVATPSPGAEPKSHRQ